MSKVIEDTLSVTVDTWDDPGDYPNNVAQYALPSHNYVEGVEGHLKIELEQEELKEFLEIQKNEEEVQDFIHETIEPDYPCGITSATWEWELSKNILILTIGEEFEYEMADIDENDYYDEDRDYYDE